MYAFYRQVHPPSGMEHNVYCNFMSTKEKNLVVSGVNYIHVYRLNKNVEAVTKQGDKTVTTKKQKLEMLGSFHLFGNIMSMQSVRLAGNARDSLLVSFRHGKLSLLDYDPSTHDVKTTSMHYFEEEELKGGLLQQNQHIPTVRVDPEGRAAAMIIFGTHMVILPFKRDQGADDADAILSGTSSKNKGSVMSSYIIDLQKLDEKITNVVDFQFLHGYYEPTVFILYEPLPTWSGRVAVRKDTCNIVAISLNIQEKVHPIIWSLAGLPYDSFYAQPVPKPIGGVLIFAINSLLYLNQSVPPYGVSLNSHTEFSTEFLLKTQEGVKMTLDTAQSCFISYDKLVISLKGGELYVLTLVVDGMRAVRSFHFDKAAASVITTSICTCGDGFLFLGSRLGNSLLLKYTEKEQTQEALAAKSSDEAKNDSDEPPNKKKKAENIGEWMASDVNQLDDMDEIEVYGSETQATGVHQITSYTFEVCDSILNIGPCGEMQMGEPAFLSEEFAHTPEPDLELVTTSGFGKNGALSVLQRSIRPQVVTTFELPGCQDMWTVVGPKADNSKDGEQNKTPGDIPSGEEGELSVENGHALMILSRDDSSMVLQTGQEIMELDHSGFNTAGPTVYAGNIGNNTYILQVSETGIRLMEGVNQLQHIPIDVGSPIVACSVADPYILIMTAEGQVMFLHLKKDHETGDHRLVVSRHQVHQMSTVLTLCAYKDVSGVFTTRMEGDIEVEPEQPPAKPVAEPFHMDVDDEDELLYGDSGSKLDPKREDTPEQMQASSNEVEKEIVPTYWAALARENGVLEIYQLPEFELMFLVKNFPVGYKVLVDSGDSVELARASTQPAEKVPTVMPPVQELLIVGLGHKQARPHLMARVDGELYIYEAFPYYQASEDERLKLRFTKINHGLIVKERKIGKAKKGREDSSSKKANGHNKWLRPFEDISGYSGVFVCGPYPYWLFMSVRGALRYHPMGIDGWVTCFAPFHNVNCPKGFLYFNNQGELRISVLPTHLSYDAPWPIRKVALRCTPHHVQYHPDSKTYAVSTSVGEPCNRLVKVQGEGEKEFETIERTDERYLYPLLDKFSVQLFSPVSWEAIPNTKFDLDDFEHVTCMKHVTLKSEGTLSGRQGYIAVGTNNTYGEEVTSRGRILIFDVIEVVPEPGQPLTKNKIKMEYDKEQKGPVTAIDSVHGFLVSAIGQKIYIWQLKDNDLSGVAFIDTQIYICSIAIIKNLILVGDVLKSISLLRYQQEMKVLSQVSRDIRDVQVYSCAFSVDDTNLCMLSSDNNQNLLLYHYQPEVRESCGGQRLLRRGDINIGSHVNTFFRIRCKLTDPSTERRLTGMVERRHINYFATLDGSVGFLLPVSEKVYRRLLMLQNALTTQMPHLGGLNPKAYRYYNAEQKQLVNPQRNILDGDLLWKYLHMNVMERSEIAWRIGTQVETIIDDLMEVDRLTAHF